MSDISYIEKKLPMTNMTETIVINGSKEVAEAIRNVIDAQPGSQSHVTERKNLDGNTAAWIVIATPAGQALPHVLGFVEDYLATKQVKKIKVGEWDLVGQFENASRINVG